MPLEAATYINQLVVTNPVGAVDPYSTADDHLRLLKQVLQNQFPNLGAAAVTPSAADLNILAGAAAGGLSAAELMFVNGVTSAIQTQLDAKLSTANDAVGNANLANMAQATIKGRASGAGTGDPTDLTAAQVLTILLAVDGSGSGLDADTLDGLDSSAFAATSHVHAATDITSGLLAIARGGTNAGDAATARTNLGVAIGSNVQAWSARLDQIAAAAVTDNNFLVATGTGWAAESAATARGSLGLGSLATLSSVNDGNWSGTDLAVANGGTGASDAATARSNLGAAASSHTHAVGDITGTLPLANGGTGQTTQLGITREVTKAWTIQSDPGGTPTGTAGDVFAYY